ncbi:MAG: Asp-tRNA(Asn)/Glu-tRNA(Gln) amidotransferase subunit GatA [Chloroflexota bacterium]
MDELTDLPLNDLVSGLRAGEFSSRELTQAFLDRVERFEPWIHAFICLVPEAALAQADQADEKLARWRKNADTPLPQLLGVPIAIKDVLTVAGLPCTCGSKILEGFVPPYNATTVDRLLKAGVIVLGKTNMDEFAMGSSTENSAYGVTHNPWNLKRVAGGSSGGSAAAVAARMAPLALGTDTGGSVRQPASFCGVTGLKPTYGRVSRYGLVAYGSSLDVVGALGRTAEEVARLFPIFSGHDPKDATTVEVSSPEITFKGVESIKGLRIGVPDEYFVGGIQNDVEEAVKEAISVLASHGAETRNIRLPHTEFAVPVYYLIAPAEASANLARYDGVRYGPRKRAEDIWDVFRNTRGELFGSEVKRRIMLGTYALSAGYYEAYYGQAQKVRTLIKRDFEQAFEQVDVIAAPVAPTTAFRIGEHIDDPLSMYLEDVFTLPANLAGVPGLAFPVGFDRQGLPIGMQLMGPRFREEVLFQTAVVYQQLTDWHLHKPPLPQ